MKAFTEWRIRRLKTRVEAQKALADKLEIAEREYESSYYTDKFHSAHCKYIELNSKLKWLERSIEK